MIRTSLAALVFALVGLWAFPAAASETRYVTDEVKINMRSGESNSHRILRMLPSGAAVRVLSTDSETGYSKVRTEDGVEGYVLAYQLMGQPSARQRVAVLEGKIQALQEEPLRLAAQLEQLQTSCQKIEADNSLLQSMRSRLEQELESIKRTSANAVQIAEERNALRTQVVSMTRQLEEIRQENRDLSNRNAQHWFLIGGGVLSGGIILGLILPHLRFRRRRTSWGSL